MRASAGFSLVELVLVTLLTGILAAITFTLISGPLTASVDTARRAELTDLAETTLTRMTRELRLGLPNSFRIATAPNIVAVEMLRTLDGGRYRALPAAGAPPGCGAVAAEDPLEFVCADPQLDVLGQLTRLTDIVTGADCVTTPDLADCMVVFNTGAAGANDAYAGDNIASITSAVDDGGFDGSDRLVLSNARLTGGQAAFPLESPNQRFHIVDTPVSFVCNTATGEISRFFDYGITAAQSTAPGGSSNLLVNNVTGCDFDYDPGTATRGALVTLSLTLTEPDSGAAVTLVQQVHLSNLP